MVFLVCYGNVSGSGTILADGNSGANTLLSCSTNDGAGGGGGGGSIILNANGTINLTAVSALSANGGNGGNVNFNCVLTNNTAYGPGAGGGGGYIASTGTIPNNSILGGNNGIIAGNSSNIVAGFPPNGATKGGAGGTGQNGALGGAGGAAGSIIINAKQSIGSDATMRALGGTGGSGGAGAGANRHSGTITLNSGAGITGVTNTATLNPNQSSISALSFCPVSAAGAESIPTLSEWVMLLLSFLMATLATLRLRKR
jgi:hypothetical protein